MKYTIWPIEYEKPKIPILEIGMCFSLKELHYRPYIVCSYHNNLYAINPNDMMRLGPYNRFIQKDEIIINGNGSKYTIEKIWPSIASYYEDLLMERKHL